MTQIVSLDRVNDAHTAGVVSIGNFDGVHRGHTALLAEVRRLADHHGGPACVLVFDPHPAAILRPSQTPARLTWIERRAELMARVGIDYLIVCQTTQEFLQQTAERFFESLVVNRLAAQAVVEGPNFFFGSGRGGDVAMLGRLCEAAGIELAIVEPTGTDQAMISSTRIRNLLADAQIERATELLGVYHRIRGRVEPGQQRGRTLAFPRRT